MLIHGMSCHLPREHGLIQPERVGPFIPPMTAPGIVDVVLTQSLRAVLEGAGLSGLGFRPVVKRHIVELDWQFWDRSSPEPAEYPSTGEPEDYILSRPHAPNVADALGELWQLWPSHRGCVEQRPEGVTLIGPTAQGSDFVLAPLGRNDYVLVSEFAMKWLTGRVGEWVRFKEFRVADV
jgi:hypothetical protein